MKFNTGTWKLSLPDDWEQKEPSKEGALYFESADGSKGVYVATWNLGASGPPDEAVRAFRASEERALRDMDGYSWSLVGEQASEAGGAATLVLDHLAAAKCYRIVTKILARPPLAVRASFHDYLCEDYDTSRALLAPFLDSLAWSE